MLATTQEKLIDLLEKISSSHECPDQKLMIRSLKHGLWASGQELAWADVTGWGLDQIQDHLADELPSTDVDKVFRIDLHSEAGKGNGSLTVRDIRGTERLRVCFQGNTVFELLQHAAWSRIWPVHDLKRPSGTLTCLIFGKS